MRSCCALVLLLACGCGGGDRTSIVLDLTAPDLSVPGEVDSLGFEAHAADGTSAAETRPLDSAFPHTVTLVPAAERSSATVTVRLWLSRADAPVLQRVVMSAFVPGEVTRVPVVLERACLGVTCALDEDCRAGACVAVLRDGGPADGGPIDARPPVDAPADAPPVEVCGNGDEDGDGLVDEGLPCRGNVVISELATGAIGLPNDEFIELYNTTGQDVDIGGLTVAYRGVTDTTFRRLAAVPAGRSIPAWGHFLISAEGFTGLVRSDMARAWTLDLDAAGGAIKISFMGDLDQLGWGSGDAELMPVSAPWTGSYERKACLASTLADMAGGADATAGNGLDCDDNASDFVLRGTRDPQNTDSAAEPVCAMLCEP